MRFDCPACGNAVFTPAGASLDSRNCDKCGTQLKGEAVREVAHRREDPADPKGIPAPSDTFWSNLARRFSSRHR